MLQLNCADSYIQYMDVPLATPAQILDGFFAPAPPDLEPPKDLDLKDTFEDKVRNFTCNYYIGVEYTLC